MNWGLRNRLVRVLPGLPKGTGSIMFTIDHGYFMGPTSGLENPRETIVPLLPHLCPYNWAANLLWQESRANFLIIPSQRNMNLNMVPMP